LDHPLRVRPPHPHHDGPPGRAAASRLAHGTGGNHPYRLGTAVRPAGLACMACNAAALRLPGHHAKPRHPGHLPLDHLPAGAGADDAGLPVARAPRPGKPAGKRTGRSSMTLQLLAGPLGFALVLGLIALGVPIGMSMAIVGTLGAIWLGGWDQAAYILSNLPFESISGESMVVLPLFIFMGVFAAHSGLSANLYSGVHALIGHYRGGIAMATVGASAIFGAITGSSLATAATIGRVAMPEM